MDPNNPQPQEGNPNLGKLEEDLQRLTKEASLQSPQAPILPPVPTLVPTPIVAETLPTQEASPVVEPVMTTVSSTPPTEKKNSPVVVVALVLMVLAILAVIAYVVGMRFFAPGTTATPVPNQSLEVIPTEEPAELPIETSVIDATVSSEEIPAPTESPVID